MTPLNPELRRWLFALVSMLVIGLVAGMVWTGPVKAATKKDFFGDDNRSVHEPAINAVASAGLVLGCNPPDNDKFCPERPVTRGEMATILARAKKIEPLTGGQFVDVESSVHRRWIWALGSEGISKGCNPPANDHFCPNLHMSRQEMAAFLARAFDLVPAESGFVDSKGGAFSANIGAIAEAGWVNGCNPPANDRFCPRRSVTRGEVATVLTRALNLPTYDVIHPEEPPVDDGGRSDGNRTTTTTTSPRSGGRGSGSGGSGSGFPGEPAPGTIYWGSSIHGNGDPVARHEHPSGHTLGIRRTYFAWNQRTGGMISKAGDDVGNGRLPWVSIKTPVWSEMASGQHDRGIDEMLRALDALPGPVWLTVWHEPENDLAPGQTPSTHLEMNRRVRQRMDALGVDNVALVQILMAWTYNPLSGRDPFQWFDAGVYDVLGVDIYQRGEASMLTENWFRVRSWAHARGMDIAVGEWGLRGTDAAAGDRVREWYRHAVNSHADGAGARVIALSAFDSGLNSPSGSWELRGAQLAAFHDLMGAPTTALP